MTSRAHLAAQVALASADLKGYDPEQSKLMDERCILVDEDDNAIGAMDKKTCTSRPARGETWILINEPRTRPFNGEH